MKTILALLIISVICVSASMVFARNLPAMTNASKLTYKTMLQNYFHPVLHGYGIGISGDNYITAKWNILNVRILARNKIKEIISETNTTDWSGLKEEIQAALQNEGTEIKKGRIRIGKTDYLLTNIQVSNDTATADIRTMPDYATCKQANTTAEDCEINAEKVGDFSLAKKANVIEESQPDPRVWAGTMNFQNVSYAFVTFAYPR